MSTPVTAVSQRLHRAVRAIGDPPSAPGWNHSELHDLLDTTALRPASVLVAIVERADGPSALFTQRTDHLAQHAGQVSFPGGGVDPGDRDAVATALRETHEEVGIDRSKIHPFGYLDCLETVSGFCVTPVVADLDADYSATPNPAEVAAVFEVPLAFFIDPANLRRRRIDYRGRPREIFEFSYAGRIIWGATAAMLLSLVRRMDALK
ncbi:MAG: CoA pyrophosphatase [Rudaea sp.]|nr:CoA pyrophosphatase [Rudaea sp.]